MKYYGKVSVHHKNKFNMPDVYEIRGKKGMAFKNKKQALEAAKAVGRKKLYTKKYPIGSSIAYEAMPIKIKKVGVKDLSFGFGDYY